MLSAGTPVSLILLAWAYSFWPTLVSIYRSITTLQLDNARTIFFIAGIATLVVARWYKLRRIIQYCSQYGILILFLLMVWWAGSFVRGQEFSQHLSVILMIPAVVLIKSNIAAKNLPWFKPTMISCCIILASPWLADNIKNNPWSNKKNAILFNAPRYLPNWLGPFELSRDIWQPSFIGATQTITASYIKNMEYVYLYAAYFKSYADDNRITNPSNKLYTDKIWQNIGLATLNVKVTPTVSMNVREEIIQAGEVKRIIWSWYYVGSTMTTNDNLIKLLESASLVSKMADYSAVVALMTTSEPTEDLARERLQQFLCSLYPQIHLVMNPAIAAQKK